MRAGTAAPANCAGEHVPGENVVGQPSFPSRLQIQTTVACGAACTICPHPRKSPSWPNGPIDDRLFDRIVAQLPGRAVKHVCPYLMADPLSDRKIFDRVRQLRAALPETSIELSTTGMYLTPALAEKLLRAPLNELRISSHGITGEEYSRTMPNVDFLRAMTNIRRFIALWQQERPYKLSIVSLWGLWPAEREVEIEAYWRELGVQLCKWRVTSRSTHVDLSAFPDGSPDPTAYRAGRREPPYLCRERRDSEWMHILSDGRVTLCCMDYGQEVILGDVRQAGIAAIWSGAAYRAVRARIRGDLPMADNFLCARCEWHVSRSVYEEHNRRKAAVGTADAV